VSQVTLLTGPERRRRWSDDEQRRILAEAFAPGAIVKDVSRRYEVSTSLIYKWRRHILGPSDGAAFAPAVVANEPGSTMPETAAITVELASGARVRIGAGTPAALAAATLRALR